MANKVLTKFESNNNTYIALHKVKLTGITNGGGSVVKDHADLTGEVDLSPIFPAASAANAYKGLALNSEGNKIEWTKFSQEPDWEQEDQTKLDFIKHRPAIKRDTSSASLAPDRNTGVRLNDVTGNTASGSYALAEGAQTQATGTMSHAEGYQTIASGEGAHAENNATRAIGNNSHAEGVGSYAEGWAAHAEGHSTAASGVRSHAEGYESKAKGEGGHAEGYQTITSEGALYSHAEGYKTLTIGLYAHAEGNQTTASGEGAHAEGNGTKATGNNSHAEGYKTTASVWTAHAEGDSTTASGNFSHAEGINTLASANGTHVEGYNTTASASYAHVEGYQSQAKGTGSHVEGYQTITSEGADYSHAEGYQTKAIGGQSHAEGLSSRAEGWVAHAEGRSTIANGSYAHAEGESTTSSGAGSHAEGYQTLASGNNSHAEGNGTKATISGAHAEGYQSEATGPQSHAEGYRTKATANWAHAEGYYTEAASQVQHVQGKYNVNDTTGKYADIVGWGTSTARKNISSLTTAGDLHLKQDAYIQSNDDGTDGYRLVPVFWQCASGSGTTAGMWIKLCHFKLNSHFQGRFLAMRIFFGNGNNGRTDQNAFIDLTMQSGWSGDTTNVGRVGCNWVLDPIQSPFTLNDVDIQVIATSGNLEYDVWFWTDKPYCWPSYSPLYDANQVRLTHIGNVTQAGDKATKPTGTACNIAGKMVGGNGTTYTFTSNSTAGKGQFTVTPAGGTAQTVTTLTGTIGSAGNATTAATPVYLNAGTITACNIKVPVDQIISSDAYYPIYMAHDTTAGSIEKIDMASQAIFSFNPSVKKWKYTTTDNTALTFGLTKVETW